MARNGVLQSGQNCCCQSFWLPWQCCARSRALLWLVSAVFTMLSLLEGWADPLMILTLLLYWYSYCFHIVMSYYHIIHIIVARQVSWRFVNAIALERVSVVLLFVVLTDCTTHTIWSAIGILHLSVCLWCCVLWINDTSYRKSIRTTEQVNSKCYPRNTVL